MVLCEADGLAFLDPVRTPEEYDAYYRGGYYGGRLHGIADVAAAREKLRRKGSKARFAGVVAFLRDGLKPSSRVLEIGAGFGNLLSAIRDATGATVAGIEPSEIAAAVARDEYGVEVRPVGVEVFLASGAAERYDLVILHHVLEHLLDPAAALRALTGFLAPGGRLYVAVPNLLDIREAPDDFFRTPHPWNFTPHALMRLLEETGWTVTAFRPQAAPKTGMELLATPAGAAKAMIPFGEEGRDAGVTLRYLHRVDRRYRALAAAKRFVERLVPKRLTDAFGMRLRRLVARLRAR